jgi:hypothetical protein
LTELEVTLMAQAQVYEGTLEEIVSRYGSELAGHRLKVYVNDATLDANVEVTPTQLMATAEQWEEALRSWANTHDRTTPLLSDAAVDRESIYEGRGV